MLVGLSTGSLRIYRVNEDAESHNGTANGAAHPGAGPLGAGAGADAHADSDAHADGDAHAHAHADAPPAKPKAADLLREEERFSRRPIQQLGFLKETNILISLSDITAMIAGFWLARRLPVWATVTLTIRGVNDAPVIAGVFVKLSTSSPFT